jgi:hypothetical protein
MTTQHDDPSDAPYAADEFDQRVRKAQGFEWGTHHTFVFPVKEPDKFDEMLQHTWRDGIFSEYVEGVIHGALYVIALGISLLTIVLWFQ